MEVEDGAKEGEDAVKGKGAAKVGADEAAAEAAASESPPFLTGGESVAAPSRLTAAPVGALATDTLPQASSTRTPLTSLPSPPDGAGHYRSQPSHALRGRQGADAALACESDYASASACGAPPRILSSWGQPSNLAR